MSKYLEELYWQHNEENFDRSTKSKELQSAVNTFSHCENVLTKRLKGKDLRLFIKSVDAADTMTANIAVDNFTEAQRPA